MKTAVQNQQGMSLVEIIVAAAVILASLSAYLAFESFRVSLNAYGAAQTSATNVRSSLFALLNDSNVWASVVANTACNPSFSCIGHNCAGVSGPINCVSDLQANPHPNSIINSSNPLQGFARDGSICFTFNPAGSPDCPMQYTLSWTAICPAGLCPSPDFDIRAKFQSAWGQNFPFDDAAENFSMRK